MRTKLLSILFLSLFAVSSFADEILRVGVIQSTTGIAAEDGKTVVQALQLAAKDINEGQARIELLIEDDASIPRNTVSSYQKLKAKGVEVFLAATWDFTANSLFPLVGKERKILFNTSIFPEALFLEQSLGYGFANGLTVRGEARSFEKYLDKNRTKSIAIIYANNTWGEVQRAEYRRVADSRNLSVLLEQSSVAFDRNEWRELLPRLKSLKPDIIALLLNKNDIDVFIRRATELGLDAKYFASKNLYDALRMTKYKRQYEGVCFTYPSLALKKNKEFFERYSKAFGEEPRINADTSYDGLWILAKAHRLASEKGISMKQALMETQHQGLSHHYIFDSEDSFRVDATSLNCIKQGEILTLDG
mgnify:CR=1 FL=1